MLERRKQQEDISPRYEDTGLYNNALVVSKVELVPMMTRNNRRDLVVRGYVQGQSEVSVVFPGRRAREVAPLQLRLQSMLERYRKEAQTVDETDIDTLRLPVTVQGRWRSHFQRDKSGWQTRGYQLVAAQWGMINEMGEAVFYGEPPKQ